MIVSYTTEREKELMWKYLSKSYEESEKIIKKRIAQPPHQIEKSIAHQTIGKAPTKKRKLNASAQLTTQIASIWHLTTIILYSMVPNFITTIALFIKTSNTTITKRN